MIEEFFELENKEEVANLAAKLAKNSKKGDIIGLKGTLGAGKSFFAAAFINALSESEIVVTSPTFNLMNIYEISSDKLIYHFDLYRLEEADDLPNIGIEEAFINGISLIEWPQIAQDFILKTRYTEVEITILSNDKRRIRIVFPHQPNGH